MPVLLKLGIDIGSSSVKSALLDANDALLQRQSIVHKGAVHEALSSCMETLCTEIKLPPVLQVAFTGNVDLLRSDDKKFLFANDIEAVRKGCEQVCKEARCVVSIGSRTAMFASGIRRESGAGLIVNMNDDCASGTGSFLEDQVSRLGLSLEEFSLYANKATRIPRIAGRCSVFAKTDITHHQQAGEPVENILKGLAYAVAKSIRGSLIKRRDLDRPVAFVGGVALNSAVISALKDVLELADDEMLVPRECLYVGAIGAARAAGASEQCNELSELLDHLKETGRHAGASFHSGMPPLAERGQDDSEDKHVCVSSRPELLYLGIDAGSTSTNLVLVDPDRQVIDYAYIRTKGNPINALFHGVQKLGGLVNGNPRIAGIGVTGSGRHIIAKHLGTGSVVNEITAQAKAAMLLDDSIDTIFEIGGQDSKFICVKDGRVTDFKMNKVCAAGTGSFIEEQAEKFKIPIEDFGRLALTGTNPPDLGERCTVFIETSIAAYLSRGAELKDIASGLCYAVAKNFLHRVVGNKPLGEKIAFQGGVAFNQGVVNAFRELTEKEITVPPFFSVSGALGAAVFAMETGPKDCYFKGEAYAQSRQSFVDAESSCFDRAARRPDEYTAQMEQLVFDGYDGVVEPDKPTVGIPRALYAFGMFSIFYTFFKSLGLNVVLSKRSDDETVRLSQEYATAETCYPVKLILGHVADLIRQKVDFIFFPELFTVNSPGSHTRQNFGCAYMQTAFKIVEHAMRLRDKKIQMLSPAIAFSLGPELIRESFSKIGRRLGKSPSEVSSALKAGMDASRAFEERMAVYGKKVLSELDSEKITFVIVSKIYGVVDPLLTVKIPEKLTERGYRVLPFFSFSHGDISKEHPNMYWPFGQHMLKAAKAVKEKQNVYAVLLTHHCCGPDSVLQHYFAEIMGDKPFLNIEVDEHASDVGVITRIEAFLDSLKKIPTQGKGSSMPQKHPDVEGGCRLASSGPLPKHSKIYLPHLFPYSQIFAAIFKARGFNAELLPPTNSRSIALGRRHTQTNEYLSLTALLGDVLAGLESDAPRNRPSTLFLPQTEGAEVDGQYSRFIKSVLDGLGRDDVEILSLFVEDLLLSDESIFRETVWGVSAGDILKQLPMGEASDALESVTELIFRGRLDIAALEKTASDVQLSLDRAPQKKVVLVLGEPLILFNDRLSGDVFKTIKNCNRRAMCAPLSEALLLTLRDHLRNNHRRSTSQQLKQLDLFELWTKRVSAALGDHSPFSEDPRALVTVADRNLGYFAGAFGRYRIAKTRCAPTRCDGVISAASTYENTEIALGVLQKAAPGPLPVLNLFFDGEEMNEKNRKMLEAFLHYL